MGKRLFIIGNGFDLEHKLSTRYTDFLEYLSYGEGAEIGGGTLVSNIENLYGYSSHYFWNDFEKNLGQLSPDVILSEALAQRNTFNSEFDYENLNDDNNEIAKDMLETKNIAEDL